MTSPPSTPRTTRRLLAIESATDWLSVALLEGEEVVDERSSEARMQHAAALLPAIDATLRAAAMDLEAVDAIAISTGPGSFTSLRIGLATVKGLGFRRDLEAIGISTLEAMAVGGLEGGERGEVDEVLALLDARRGQWYAGSWRSGATPSAQPEPVLAEGLYAPDRLAAQVGIGHRVGVVAPQDGTWRDALQGAGIDLGWQVEGEAARPQAQWVGRLGQRRLNAGAGMPSGAVEARYLRRAEAEAKRLGGPVEAGEVADLGASGEPG